MPTRKRICIDLERDSPLTKEQLLEFIKAELDKDFQTDIVDESTRITVTIEKHTSKIKKT